MKNKFFSFISLIFVGIILLSGCSFLPSDGPKTFSSDGLTLTLTEGFWETEYDPFTVCFDSSDMAVFALEETFEMFEAAGYTEMPTVREYAELVAYANGVDTASVSENDGLTGFIFSKTVDGSDYTYFAYTYKGSDSFWLLQFAVATDSADEYADTIMEYAISVTVE